MGVRYFASESLVGKNILATKNVLQLSVRKFQKFGKFKIFSSGNLFGGSFEKVLTSELFVGAKTL